NLLVYVHAFAMLGHAISQLTRAPMLGFLDLAALLGASMLDHRQDLLDLVLRCCRPRDKDQIVQTLFHGCLFLFLLRTPAPENSFYFSAVPLSSSVGGGSRRLYLFIAASIPFVSIISTASPAWPIISAVASSSAFRIGRSTNSLRLFSG